MSSLIKLLKEDTDLSGVTKISKDDPDKQNKITQAQANKQSYELYEDEELEEMARIGTLFTIKDDVNPEEFKNETVQKILKALQANPEGMSKIALANAVGFKYQQPVNHVINSLMDRGLVISKGLASEPKYKSKDPNTEPSPRGRKPLERPEDEPVKKVPFEDEDLPFDGEIEDIDHEFLADDDEDMYEGKMINEAKRFQKLAGLK